MSLSAMISSKFAAWWDTAWVGLTPAGKAMLLLGLFGQTLFVLRWFVQLLASEKAKQSIVPEIFWYFSLAGSILVFAYALYIANLVLIVGQFGLFIYARNIYLIRRARSRGDGLVAPRETAG